MISNICIHSNLFCSYQVLAVQCTATNTSTTHSHDMEKRAPNRQDAGQRSYDLTVRRQIVWPHDRKDKLTNSKTAKFLEQFTQHEVTLKGNVFSYQDSSDNSVYWLVNVTDSQVDMIKKNAGPFFLLLLPRPCTNKPLDTATGTHQVSSEV